LQQRVRTSVSEEPPCPHWTNLLPPDCGRLLWAALNRNNQASITLLSEWSFIRFFYQSRTWLLFTNSVKRLQRCQVKNDAYGGYNRLAFFLEMRTAAYAVRLAAQRSVVTKICFTSLHQRRATWSSDW